jgi:hypothetical protein
MFHADGSLAGSKQLEHNQCHSLYLFPRRLFSPNAPEKLPRAPGNTVRHPQRTNSPQLSKQAKPASALADINQEQSMSTRSSIWLGIDKGKSVHIYWELADRNIENGRMTGAPIYIAVDAGNADEEVAIRLPREIAIQLLMKLSPDWDDELGQVL